MSRLRDRLFTEGRHGEALETARKVAAADPGRESLFRLGFLLREVGHYREALKAFRDALRFRSGPKYMLPQIHLHAAHAWYMLKDFKRMREALDRAYALPTKPRTTYNLHLCFAWYFESTGRLADALREHKNAARTAPSAMHRGRALANQGVVLLRLGRRREAKERLDAAMDIHKRNRHRAELAKRRLQRAAIYFDEGELHRALGMVARAAISFHRLGMQDLEATALANAAYVRAELKEWERALHAANRAIALARKTGRWDLLGCAHACRATIVAHLESPEAAGRDLRKAREHLRGRRNPRVEMFVHRAEARLAECAHDWSGMRDAGRSGERVAARAKDLIRVAEFRKMRAVAEKNLGRLESARRARMAAFRVAALARCAGDPTDELLRRARKLARTSLPLLILGEPGAGKTELARAVHGWSPRAGRPCVLVPCEHLVFAASELCGHVRGAWSHAGRDSAGFVALARNGTVILDRLDDLASDEQRALVPLLEGKLRSVGATGEHRTRVRFLATACREDRIIPAVLERISGAVLRVPSLRERRGEVAHLVHAFLDNRRNISADALAELSTHPWDGNLTELRSAVDRLVSSSSRRIGKNEVVRALKTAYSLHRAPRLDKERISSRTVPVSV